MDRRDFLKLFALSTAGLYVPTRSYFFMPRPLEFEQITSVWIQKNPTYGYWLQVSKHNLLSFKLSPELLGHNNEISRLIFEGIMTDGTPHR